MKEKITISIDPDLIEKLDKKIDDIAFRSRSQVIETLLLKSLFGQRTSTAVIMLKAKHQYLVFKKFDKKNLLEKQVEWLKKHDINEILIVTEKTKFLDELKNYSQNQSVRVLVQKSGGTAQALLTAKSFLENKTFLVMYGDLFSDFNLSKMIDYHMKNKLICTLALMTKKESSEYGNILMEGNLIGEFTEKPIKEKSPIVNAGFYLLNNEVWDELNKSTKSVEKELFPQLSKKRQLGGFFISGYYIHLLK